MKICRDSKTLAFQDMEAIVKLQEEIKARRIIPFLDTYSDVFDKMNFDATDKFDTLMESLNEK